MTKNQETALELAADALTWVARHALFSEGGKYHGGWEKTGQPALDAVLRETVGDQNPKPILAFEPPITAGPVAPTKCLSGTMQDGTPIVVVACPVHGNLSLEPVDPEAAPVGALAMEHEEALASEGDGAQAFEAEDPDREKGWPVYACKEGHMWARNLGMECAECGSEPQEPNDGQG